MTRIIIQIPNNKLDDVAADMGFTHGRVIDTETNEPETDIVFLTRIVTEKFQQMRKHAHNLRVAQEAANDASIDADISGSREGA